MSRLLSTIIYAIGILGGLCFAYCGVPTAWRTFKARRSVGTPIDVAIMILLGGVLMFSYLMITRGFDPILAINHSIETLSWAVVVFFHYRPRAR